MELVSTLQLTFLCWWQMLSDSFRASFMVSDVIWYNASKVKQGRAEFVRYLFMQSFDQSWLFCLFALFWQMYAWSSKYLVRIC